MNRTEQLISIVDKCRDVIINAEDYIWANPEPGYQEWKTTKYMEDIFTGLGYELVKAGDIPGFYADLDTGKPGPKVAIIGELDSLIGPNHPACDPETKAIHACGHCAQSATLAGVAAALKQPGALDGLCGSIRLISVPAEELIQLGYREQLRKEGKIHYLGGKVEFIYRGFFDNVDMAMMFHANILPEGKYLYVEPGCNGCIVKNLTFKGYASHAGSAPDKGINALYAATSALNTANALRETFLESDYIRFHPIITEGGDVVNTIPDTVKVETYVRGASYDAMAKYNYKLNRAMACSAAAMGANVVIEDRPGYLPLINDTNLRNLSIECMKDIAGPDCIIESEHWDTGSTDMGDVSAIMPAVHPYAGGSIGTIHGNDFYIDDKERACVAPAKCMLLMADRILTDDAKLGKKIIAEKNVIFNSKEEYLEAIDHFMLSKEAVKYDEKGNISIDIAN